MAQPPETFPPQEIFDFLQEIRVHLACDPGNRYAFFDLFADFSKSEITDGEHVLARAMHLLQSNPRLLAQFHGLIDPVRQGLDFLKRAEKALGRVNYDRFVTKLYIVDGERSLDAHGVYQEFKALLGEFKHLTGEVRDDLLRGLAGFLPTKYDPPPPRASAKAEREERRRRPERKHSSYAGAADAPESGRPSRPKKPRVVADVEGPTPQPICFADTGGAAGSSTARRPCIYEYDYDGWLPELKPDPCAVAVADDSKSSRPSRVKKPRADDGMSRHAPVGAAAGGSVCVAAAQAQDANAREVKRFREAWEFETGYSLLDATLKRTKEAKSERERLKGARASLDELFPRPEIRGYLAKMYHGRWNRIRQLLEHGGDHTDFALEAMVNRLERKDAEAVDEARRRQDPARAAQRLQELAQERVRETKEANLFCRREPRASPTGNRELQQIHGAHDRRLDSAP